MQIKIFTLPQLRHVKQAVYEYWNNTRAMFRTESIQTISQLNVGHWDAFQRYVKELVRFLFVRFSVTLTSPCSRRCRLSANV